MQIEKQYVRKELSGYTSSYADPFQYQSVEEIGEEIFIKIFKDIMSVSLSRDDQVIEDAAEEFYSLIKYAGDAFDRNTWYIAFIEGNPTGLILPQRYPHQPSKGSIFYLGILSQFRGRGYSKILHAKSLEILSKQGVVEYVGSADVLNKPMISAFLANGCSLTDIRSSNL